MTVVNKRKSGGIGSFDIQSNVITLLAASPRPTVTTSRSGGRKLSTDISTGINKIKQDLSAKIEKRGTNPFNEISALTAALKKMEEDFPLQISTVTAKINNLGEDHLKEISDLATELGQVKKDLLEANHNTNMGKTETRLLEEAVTPAKTAESLAATTFSSPTTTPPSSQLPGTASSSPTAPDSSKKREAEAESSPSPVPKKLKTIYEQEKLFRSFHELLPTKAQVLVLRFMASSGSSDGHSCGALFTCKPTDDDLEATEPVMYDDTGFRYNQNKENPDFDPNNPDYDAGTKKPLTETRRATSRVAGHKPKQSSADSNKIWKKTLHDMPMDELGSPKVKKIADLIIRIRSRYLDKKIIAASASVRFLDILGQYLARQLPDLETASFDGRIASVDERMGVANRFNSQDSGVGLLLLSAACGGTGLNLHGGSHVIMAVYFWAPGLQKQVIGRAARLPQKRQVYIYHIRMKTAVDGLIGTLVEKKKDVEFPLESTFRCEDNAPYVQGRLPNRAELQQEMADYDRAGKA
ncbi:DNA repair rad5 [Fusarium longipes]|uniref:DNA repair rad5 n=1 Tax=Fusarium longipes TaxID=694270 RepID=A0A395RQU5_9HYPO|nr:DNA repair rad5 [Fusarium longipes]